MKDIWVEQDYYHAEMAEWDGKECKAFIAINIRKTPERNVFTVKLANEIIDMANEKYKEIHGKEADFQTVKINLTNYMINTSITLEDGVSNPRTYNNRKIGTYDKRKNVLRIWIDDIPVYENNNGKICRDSGALADCLM